jgi:plasmid stability protein
MTETVSDGWLLVKRGLYWRPNAQGYTGLKEEAGVYSDEQSAAYRDHDDVEVTIRIRASEADDIAPGCSAETEARYWKKRAETAEAERDMLAKAASVFSKWTLETSTLGGIEKLEHAMKAAGLSLMQVGEWAKP